MNPILPQNFCDPETHNLTEVWTQLKNGVIAKKIKRLEINKKY